MKKTGKKKERLTDTLVAIWLPRPLLRALDREVAARDTDRSKLIRQVLRRELSSVKARES